MWAEVVGRGRCLAWDTEMTLQKAKDSVIYINNDSDFSIFQNFFQSIMKLLTQTVTL